MAQLQIDPDKLEVGDMILVEGFVAPLHWGFVFFGWMALGVFGVVLQILGRVHALLGKEGTALLA
jgi:hypothetical protein